MKRFNIFSGTTNFKDWIFSFKLWIKHNYTNDEEIIKFYEKRFAQAVSSKHAISFGSGRMALYSILEALDIGEGDEIILPAFTCVVVPNALIYKSVVPKYVDISVRDFNMDVTKIEAMITEKTKAIYAQHTFGIPCNLRKIKEIADKYGLLIIEDAAHALGSMYEGYNIGTWSNATFYSSDHSKVISTYLGGIATTNDDKTAHKIKNIQSIAPHLPKKDVKAILRSYLLEWLYFSPYILPIGRYIHAIFRRLGWIYTFNDELRLKLPIDYPYPCRLSSAQAGIGVRQIERLDQNLNHRRKIANFLETEIGYYGLSSDEVSQITWIRYSMLVKDRTAFIKKFKKHFDLGIWFDTIFGGRSEGFSKVGYTEGSCPSAEYVAKHIVNFPTHERIPFNFFKQQISLNKDWIKNQVKLK